MALIVKRFWHFNFSLMEEEQEWRYGRRIKGKREEY
jgi:hypothetical protein